MFLRKEAQALDLLGKDFKRTVKYAQRFQGNHEQRTKGNKQNNVSTNKEYQIKKFFEKIEIAVKNSQQGFSS